MSKRNPTQKMKLRDSTAVEQLVAQGIASHQQGNLRAAKQFYGQALALSPNHFDALQLLATALTNLGELGPAENAFKRALKVNRSNDAVLLNFSIALNSKGNALKRQGAISEALKAYEEAVVICPTFPDAHNNLGNTLCALGKTEASLAHYKMALIHKPAYPEALVNWGIALHELGRFEEAIDRFRVAISLNENDSRALTNCANSLAALHRPEEALSCYARAIQAEPGFDLPYISRGSVLLGLNRRVESLASYSEAVRINHENPDAHAGKAAALMALGRNDHALESYRAALSLRPDDIQICLDLGIAEIRFGRFADAVFTFDRAIQFDQGRADLHFNHGVSLHHLGRYRDAIQSFEQAIKLNPVYEEALRACALTHLLIEDYKRGWDLYEYRLTDQVWGSTHQARPFAIWDGQPAKGSRQRILVRFEQGFGDVIQFVRYLPMIKSLGFDIVLEAPVALEALLADLDCESIQVVPPNAPVPSVDFQCWLMSLPRLFKTDANSIPCTVPYIRACKEKVRSWQLRLGKKTTPRVGLVWSGRAEHANDHLRSIPLSEFSPLFELPVEYHSLQVDYRQVDIAYLAFCPKLRQHQTLLNDFTDTAALIDCMDLVISVDSSVAHLAGAMGKALWLLVPAVPDFRWLLHRNDSPWYPTARLFRQPQTLSWTSVIAELVRAISSKTEVPWNR